MLIIIYVHYWSLFYGNPKISKVNLNIHRILRNNYVNAYFKLKSNWKYNTESHNNQGS